VNDLNKKYKETFDKIEILGNKSEKVYNSILKKTVKNQLILRPTFISIIIMLCIIGIGVVYAEDISKAFNSLVITKKNDEHGNIRIETHSSARPEINYDANLPEVEIKEANDVLTHNKYSFEELEKLLNIKILRSKFFKNDKLVQLETKKLNNKIAYSSFGLQNFTNVKVEEGQYGMYFNILTKYATEEMEKSAKSIFTERNRTELYYIKSIKTEAVIIKGVLPDSKVQEWRVEFDYAEIHYGFNFMFVGIEPEEMKTKTIEILESLN